MKFFNIKSKNNTLVVLEGIGFTLILVLVAVVLIYNNVRRINNGRYNYEVYQYELQTLQDLVEKHEELQDEYEYVNSVEYKKLVLREVLGFASENETVYKRKETPVFYTNIDKQYIDLENKKEYDDWWAMLIK